MPISLRAVKMLARYLSTPADKDLVMQSLGEWLTAGQSVCIVITRPLSSTKMTTAEMHLDLWGTDCLYYLCRKATMIDAFFFSSFSLSLCDPIRSFPDPLHLFFCPILQSGSTSTLQLIAAMVYMHEGDTKEALRCVHLGTTMEHLALTVQIFLKMDRLDLALKTVCLRGCGPQRENV